MSTTPDRYDPTGEAAIWASASQMVAEMKSDELSEDWNAWAVPWNEPSSVGGTPICACACWIALTALPSDASPFRLKEIVTAGNWL